MKQAVFNSNILSKYLNTSKPIRMPFSEEDIIYLQDRFLTNGWHYIKVNNIESGRSIITTFLQSLNYHNNIACLTLSDIPLHNVFNIYNFLVDHNYLSKLDDFFLDKFYFDFLWIEATDELLSTKWFKSFKQKLEDYNIDIPIVVISY